jgi:mRNA-decapping enzyme subunit 2
MNLPLEDLSSPQRILFQVEEAQWYYEDFIRPLDPSLPALSLRNFCFRIFAHCPLLLPFSQGEPMRAFEEFLKYKLQIPVRGAIMLNEAMDSVVLVKGWKKGANWSFPRGKINKDENDLTCAIREVYEETGFDLEAAGLVPEDRDVKYIEINIRDQLLRLYLFGGIPMDTPFEPRTRKEISNIQWWRISDLPSFPKRGHQPPVEAAVNANKFYMVAPFIQKIKRWITEQRKIRSKQAANNQYLSAGVSHDEFLTEEDQGAESNTQDQPYEPPSPPDVNKLEAALKFALKIQPPTEGLQPEAITAIQSPAKDSGQQLLALLQGAPSHPPPSNAPPQTPLDHTYTQAPIPNTPHHQQTRPPQFSTLPPPPTFPIQPRNDTFSYQEPNQNTLHQHNLAALQQGRIGGQRLQERSHENPHSYQSQHLVHPQPLPPPVQRAVFNGGPVHAPLVPQPTQQAFVPSPNSTVSHTVQNPQFPNIHAPMVPAVQKQSPSSLDSHSLALLNAFKGRDQPSAENAASNDLPLQRYVQELKQAPPQELPAEVSRPLPVDFYSLFKAQAETSLTSKNNTSPSRPTINDAHRSSLLDLFKSNATQASVSPRPVAATALPTSKTPSAVELSAVGPYSSDVPSHSTSIVDGRLADHPHNPQSIPELHPETNLPYRAVSILARPAQANGSAHPERNGSARLAQSNGKERATNQSRRLEQKPSPDKPFQPQILKRPQPGISKAVASPRASPSTIPVLPIQPPFDRQTSQPPEQRQRLLSLFGKSTSSLPQQNPATRESFSSIQIIDPNLNASAKTRVGSLASEEVSRRGSQAPLSPADKDFLLGYLDGVAKGNQH